MALPKIIHVREDKEGTTTHLMAFGTGMQDAILDDGPTLVGVYQLVNTARVRKTFLVEGRAMPADGPPPGPALVGNIRERGVLTDQDFKRIRALFPAAARTRTRRRKPAQKGGA